MIAQQENCWYRWPLLPAFCDFRLFGQSKTYYRVMELPAAEEEPVTLAQARGWLRVGVTGQPHPDDDTIKTLIQTARKAAENYCDRAITPTRYLAASDHFDMPLVGPIQELVAVKYDDVNNVEQTLADTVYSLGPDFNKPAIRLLPGQSWPATNRREDCVRIEHIAGQDPELIEPPMNHAIKMMLGDMYDNRGNTVVSSGVQPYEMPLGVKFLLNPYRQMGV
jgi:uncharacterized phiE125 gp8 family phage protein